MKYRLYQPKDFRNLHDFLNKLPTSTGLQFAPHSFDENTLRKLLHEDPEHLGFLALEGSNIISYQVLKKGWVKYEWPRLQSYPVDWQYEKCATYAPVVKPSHHNKGIGRALFYYIIKQIKPWNIEKIILWGGVQSSNQVALHFYKKLGFSKLGHYEYHGDNIDMMCQV